MEQNSLGKVKGVVDMVFLLDISGSMQPCIDGLKTNISTFICFLVNPGANESAVVKDWRIKVAGYRDAEEDGNQWWQEFAFSKDVSEVVSNLAAMEAKGGGDEPESLLDALYKIASIPSAEKGEALDPGKWRHRHEAARCVIVFTDATFKSKMVIPEAAGGGFQDMANKIHESRIRLSVFCPQDECYADLSAIDKSEVVFIGPVGQPELMASFTSDKANFQKTLKQLAGSVSKSGEAPPVL